MRGHFFALLIFASVEPTGITAQAAAVAASPRPQNASAEAITEGETVSMRDKVRKREKEYAKLDRLYTKLLKRCRDGDRIACSKASETWAEMQLLLPQGSGSPS